MNHNKEKEKYFFNNNCIQSTRIEEIKEKINRYLSRFSFKY